MPREEIAWCWFQEAQKNTEEVSERLFTLPKRRRTWAS